MSKIICEVCGTAYPETAAQCPICGCSRPEEPKIVTGDMPDSGRSSDGSYTYVKGGRFSKANVRKRLKASQSAQPAPEEDLPDDAGKQSNRGLLIVMLLLLLAIAAVIIYIVVRFFVPMGIFGFGGKEPSTTGGNTTVITTAAATTTEQTEVNVPCTGLMMLEDVISLDSIGQAWLLEVTPQPTNSTDTISFSSSDESVATVTSAGRVTAVGPGTATITITCGQITAKCQVFCNIETEPPTEDTTVPETTQPKVVFELNRSDITLANKGDSWQLYSGSISKTAITWTTDNPNVATIEGGKVVAVGPGTTTVYGEYNGEKVGCIIRCSFSDPDGEGSTEATKAPADGTYTISHTDVTIAIGETFTLRLRDSNGDTVSVTWSVGDSSVCTVSGNTVTGVAAGTTTVSATYNGQTYSCIVRVKR